MPRDAESVRARIKAVDLTDMLQKHALDNTPLSATRIATALALLRKVAPDLRALDLNIESDTRPMITIMDYREDAPQIEGSPEKTPLQIDAPRILIEELLE